MPSFESLSSVKSSYFCCLAVDLYRTKLILDIASLFLSLSLSLADMPVYPHLKGELGLQTTKTKNQVTLS